MNFIEHAKTTIKPDTSLRQFLTVNKFLPYYTYSKAIEKGLDDWKVIDIDGKSKWLFITCTGKRGAPKVITMNYAKTKSSYWIRGN